MDRESGAPATAGFRDLMRNLRTPTLPFGVGAIGKVGSYEKRIEKLITRRAQEVYKRA
ncbi:MAG TPA: hypothetical protein VH299_04600 [Solirubrobacterales bacterium]|nr:hypothetical protein [Solirubrobacterales bacterium]